MPNTAAVPEAPAERLTLDRIAVVHTRKGASPFTSLAIDRLDVPAGRSLGVSGPSGAGKSTLLHVVAGLESPSAGSIRWGETRLETMGEGARDRWRRAIVGFVFQDFHLVDELSIFENVLLPARFASFRASAEARARAGSLIERVGLADPQRRAAVLSRGERQRVAVARALIGRPRLLVADEPTASLDAENGAAIADLLIEATREIGATLLVAAHDRALLDRLDRELRLVAGRPVAEDAA
ncbi:MAG: ABC transporter ATP-binding protein [Hyphomicrobiales bacterium]|nr:ABC transporter ATP-binding protein [Hyphomicrobiales bacterium]